MTLLLGIDLGTSSAKALLLDSDTGQTHSAGQEYPVLKPTPERAEQMPEDWWRAIVACVRQVLAQLPTAQAAERVSAISFSGQMHGTVLLNADNQPLHPAIIWADQRSAAEVAELTATVGQSAYLAAAGTLPAAGFMGVTLLWLRRHRADLLAQTHRVLLPKDYVRLRMTGNAATEPSDAASTGLYDLRPQSPGWATEIIERAGLPEAIFPPILGSADIAGTLTAAAAQELGLRPGIAVVSGAADQPAQALGNGIIDTGRASVTIGSGGQVFVPLHAGTLRTDARLHVFPHAVAGQRYALGAILSAGLALRWLRGITGLQEQPDAYARLSAEAGQIDPGADGLLFLPYLTGERTPHMDPGARGVFIGLSSYHTRGHLARAVMEGVTFALRQALELALSVGGSPEIVIISGGGAESGVWRQMMADVFGIPLRKSLQQEQAALGAAVLAGCGTGAFAAGTPFRDNLLEACDRLVRYGDLTEPDAHRQAEYDPLYAQFLELYPLLREQMHRLSSTH